MDRQTLWVVAAVAFLLLRSKSRAGERAGLSEEDVAAREAEAATFEDESGNPLEEQDDGTFAPADFAHPGAPTTF